MKRRLVVVFLLCVLAGPRPALCIEPSATTNSWSACWCGSDGREVVKLSCSLEYYGIHSRQLQGGSSESPIWSLLVRQPDVNRAQEIVDAVLAVEDSNDTPPAGVGGGCGGL